MAKAKSVIAMSAPVTITAAADVDGKKGVPKFDATFYTGGSLRIPGWEHPVVVDLAGLDNGKVLVANLDHDRTKRVGNFKVENDGKSLVAHGNASAATPARDEVVGSAADGYEWQASLEVNPIAVEEVKANKKVEVNGQQFTGPLYVTRKGTLKGFAFVSHGADDNTNVTIAATAASNKEQKMKTEVKAWAAKMLPSVDLDSLSAEEVANLEAQYEGINVGTKTKPIDASDPFTAFKAEAKRVEEINEIAATFAKRREGDFTYIQAMEKMRDHAIEKKMTAQAFRNEMYEQMIPLAQTVPAPRDRDMGYSNRILEAALCVSGRLSTVEKQFKDNELQAAHDKFPHGISLGQLFTICAEANGLRSSGGQVTLDTQRAAFARQFNRPIHASGFSTIDIATIVSNTANKFMMEGWNEIDQTCLRISKIRPVRNFQQATTVSLTDSVRYAQIGADGEIKHGTLDELTYTDQADTYARMLAITRKDIINDDTGALTSVPAKLGRGAIKLLNHIFWTEFLGAVAANFFASGNININTGAADMTLAGLDATEAIFMNQTNPDGTPLALMPAILLVPPALANKAKALMAPEGVIVSGSSTGIPDVNVFKGRFRVESSPYISNSSYTGYTAVGWWLLGNPNTLPVITIAALNGRVEPTVDTADAEFNTLGVQMRGYCDVGVNLTEYRGGVYADGGSSLIMKLRITTNPGMSDFPELKYTRPKAGDVMDFDGDVAEKLLRLGVAEHANIEAVPREPMKAVPSEDGTIERATEDLIAYREKAKRKPKDDKSE